MEIPLSQGPSFSNKYGKQKEVTFVYNSHFETTVLTTPKFNLHSQTVSVCLCHPAVYGYEMDEPLDLLSEVASVTGMRYMSRLFSQSLPVSL